MPSKLTVNIKGTILLKQGRDHAVKRFHPWVFSGAVQQATEGLQDGDWVEVKDQRKATLGFGHYQKGTITVRLIVFGEATLT